MAVWQWIKVMALAYTSERQNTYLPTDANGPHGGKSNRFACSVFDAPISFSRWWFARVNYISFWRNVL